MKSIVDFFKHYYNLSLATSLGSAFVLYYVIYVAQRPRLFSNDKFRAFLVQNVPILREKFWPTFWCIEARAQTILRALIKSAPEVKYHKEFLETTDGGHIALDWQQNENSPHKDPKTRPTVLILPGLTGSSEESYALHFVQQATRLGYRSLVFNYRGNGGAELKTPRSYCASETEDLALVIKVFKERYPDAPLVAAGVSLGGYKHLFEDTCDLDHVFQSKTIRDFDDRFTAKQFGYASWKEYYADASPHSKIHKISVPLLCLNAADDPFSPEHALPLKECQESSHVSILVTRHGGHIGFLEGMFPRHEGFMDRVFAQYIDAIFKHGSELQKVLNSVE